MTAGGKRRPWRSDRLSKLGSSIFAEVGQWKDEAIAGGIDVIDLGIGSPDRPPSEHVRRILSEAALRDDSYSYPASKGSAAFRAQAAAWMKHRFGVDVDPEQEIVTLMGSQDGLAHLATALCNAGDRAIVPDPGYPIYAASLAVAGVEPIFVPLKRERGYLPDLDALPESAWEEAVFILLSFPGNPVPALANADFFRQLIDKARRFGVLIVHDLAYSELGFDGLRPPSILELEGAKETAVEFHSLSKSFNMAGCRIGFLTGNAEAVGALRELKGNIDYGVFNAVQEAGIAALEEGMNDPNYESVAPLYQRRRDCLVEALRQEGWNVPSPPATMFLWAPVPQPGEATGERWSSRRISREMLLETGVVVIPGDAFGSEGEGYVRIALVESEERLQEAARRIGEWLRKHGLKG
ncbi:aminotransferase class I/II-fold pyridoxal phosphate-dependent enzyme [Paenibacillus beijingensis]|uniref:Aminotransferase n=1 Tax=Paenibacillus beijingensis TaxID=1126833 RepID=A0A0D5NE42_9BACL|nr:aminotransferase class I/II-fold pyridoxal phosphate-dependent enzyme [Paenibacillus beijingensis]AJY73634.1 aminotransferase [Paenibacillus beijingensis]